MAKKNQKTPPAAKVEDEKTTKKAAKTGKNGKSAVEETKQPIKNGRSIVAQTSSWTGKLPGSLLHEHCQKQKWGKVEYDMKKLPEGFLAIPQLQWENPKTKENIQIKYHPPKSIVKPQETPLEARHYGATYALHRIAFNKNLHMVLPTNHKNLWSDLEQERKRLVKDDPSRAKLEYANDPFAALLEKRKEDDTKRKQREAEQAAAQKVKKPTITIGSSFTKNQAPKKSSPIVKKTEKVDTKTTDTNSKKSLPLNNISKTPSFPRKVWENSIMFDIDPELRASIENAIKNHLEWSEEDSHMHETVDNVAYDDLLENLGFKKAHIVEAMKYTYTFNDSLEWLIFHLPDDDLPFCFTKQDSDSNIVLKITKDLKQERLISQLMIGGFSRTDAIVALEKNNYELIDAVVYLTNTLNNKGLNLEGFNSEHDSNDWIDEKESLKIIFESKLKEDDPPKDEIYEISLSPEGVSKDIMSLIVYKSACYPYDLCGMSLKVSNQSYSLPNYIKLAIISNLIEYLHDIGAFGMPYIYSSIDWLEQNILSVIKNPGPLYNPIKKRSTSSNEKKEVQKSARGNVIKGRKIDAAKVKDNYVNRVESKEFLQSVKNRSKLPAWNKKDEILKVINDNRVCLVTGETGSGKSTQIVQFVIDYLNDKQDYSTTIVCTQPRRISTIGLAERISEERADNCGKETGYIIRGENKTSDQTRISFVTTGVMLRMIQSVFGKSTNETDSFFKNLGYIFIDEVHERSIDSDFLLIILKKIMKNYPRLKIVLMSATIDKNIFNNYFDSNAISHAHIEGRTFPIDDFYLNDVLDKTDYKINNSRNNYYDDDENLDNLSRPSADSKYFQQGNINYDLISELIYKIDDDLTAKNDSGSILIFLPGVMETKKCLNNIEDEGFWKLPLHSALSSQEQKRIFDNPPKGMRKIIASTNIAETSITIPDAVVVIDTGRVKSVQYDARSNNTKLVEIWASKAETKQRRGRAGRIRNGICYKMFTKDTESKMIAQPIPEIKRTRLESVYLVVKAIGVKDVYQFLQNGLDPPHRDNVENARRILNDVGALDHHDDELTSLGKYLSMLPTDLKSGKIMIFGCIFGCIESCITLAAIGVTGSPFSCKEENRSDMKRTQQEFAKDNGDMVAILNAFNKYKALPNMRERRKFCTQNYLSWLRMNDIDSTRSQYLNNLKEIGFIPFNYDSRKVDKTHEKMNRNNDNISMVKSILTAASYPQIARVDLPDTKYAQSSGGAIALDPEFKKIKYWSRNEKYRRYLDIGGLENLKEEIYPSNRIFMHPSSSMFVNDEKSTSNPNFIVYNDSQETSKLYAHGITPSSTISVLLFGGSITYDLSTSITHLKSKGIVMDNWLPIRTWCKNGVLIGKLRLLLDRIIQKKLDDPQTSEGDDVLRVIEQLVKIK